MEYRGKGTHVLLVELEIVTAFWGRQSDNPIKIKNTLKKKVSACNVGDLGLIPRSGRSPGEGNGYPLWYSCLENSMEREAWQAIVYGVSCTQLSN